MREKDCLNFDQAVFLFWGGVREVRTMNPNRNLLRLCYPFLIAALLAIGATLLLLGGPPLAWATTFTVTTTASSGSGSLYQAILDANANAGPDTITFAADVSGTIVLTDTLPQITDTLTISGPGASVISISGANNYRVVNIASGTAVTITGVTIRDGLADGGGGIYSAGTLVLSDTDVVSNTATGGWPNGGGGVYVYSGTATLSGGQISGNTAKEGGGVFVLERSATLSMSGGQILSNTANWGGGVFVVDGRATLSGGQILSNTAQEQGGGVYVLFGSATLSGGQILSNTANWGGGVCVWYGGATLSGGQISGNTANSGGGVYVLFGSATLSGGQILSNTAQGEGGGVCLGGSVATLSMSGGQILSNTAEEGGGVFVFGWATLSGGQILSNTAVYSGGGVYVEGGSATLSGGQISGNTAKVGGGVGVEGGSATLSGGQIVSNTANYGGGVGVFLDSATLSMSAGQILSNTAVYSGGGVYVLYGSATLSDVQLLNNTAGTGGALYKLISTAFITVTHSCLVANSATSIGGVAVDNPNAPDLSARGNWWGAADGPSGAGPGVGDSVSANVDYSDFLTATILGCPTSPSICLPLIVENYVSAPDLVVDKIIAASNAITVVIRNQGDVAVPADAAHEFWVDLYVNPNPVPTHVDQTWQMLGSQGAAWGVTQPALPALVPGGVFTLTTDDAYYWPTESHIVWPLASGTRVYAQVDSANAWTSYGAVLESHEISGGPYNNVSGPVIVQSAGAMSLPPPVTEGGPEKDISKTSLPPRP
jgi:hypothetical protein